MKAHISTQDDCGNHRFKTHFIVHPVWSCVCVELKVRKWNVRVADPLESHSSQDALELCLACVAHRHWSKCMRLFYWSHLSFAASAMSACNERAMHAVYFMLNRNPTNWNIQTNRNSGSDDLSHMHVRRLFATRTSLKYRKRMKIKLI